MDNKRTETLCTVLIVDDEPNIRDVMKSFLALDGYEIVLAENGIEAFQKARELIPDLIITDIMMPGMDGFELTRQLREEPLLAQVPIIMITSLGDTQSRVRGIEIGADDFISKPFDIDELSAKVRNIMRLNRFRELLTEREKLKSAHRELMVAYEETIEGWARALELRDAETQGHSRRVTDVTLMLARNMNIMEESMEHIRRGALLHDIGKMGIPDTILFKKGPLTDEEWAIMKRHPDYAYQLLNPIPYLQPAMDIPYCHHERWNGSGYPRGLKEDQIPFAARIFTVVDVWDALSSNRPYRGPLDSGQIREYLLQKSGVLFDESVVTQFLRICLV